MVGVAQTGSGKTLGVSFLNLINISLVTDNYIYKEFKLFLVYLTSRGSHKQPGTIEER